MFIRAEVFIRINMIFCVPGCREYDQSCLVNRF